MVADSLSNTPGFFIVRSESRSVTNGPFVPPVLKLPHYYGIRIQEHSTPESIAGINCGLVLK